MIPAELFYHTSAAILIVPALLVRFGQCELETLGERKDRGGCQIGGASRVLERANEVLEEIGVEISRKGNVLDYRLVNRKPFQYDAENRYTFSLMVLMLALFRKGTSEILNSTRIIEFRDSVSFLKKMGADIRRDGSTLHVTGGKELGGIEFGNMYDRHDFVTLLSAALCTNSEMVIEDVNYEKMGLASLGDFIEQSGVELKFERGKKLCRVKGGQLAGLKPVDLVAADYPEFVSEWQVLLSPLFTRISGESKIVDSYYTNRMRHWEELGKMGAECEFYTRPDYPEDEEENPRAVKIKGGCRFHGAEVCARDVRSGAALVVAGLAADGETVVDDPEEHIQRGYERLPERLAELGAEIEVG